MSERVYDAWRAWRHACITSMDDIGATCLRKLTAELRGLADAMESEVARREREAERQDARLFRQRKEER